MNRLLTISMLVMLVQTTSHAQTDCSAVATKEHLQSLPSTPAYYWDANEGIAIIPLHSGDTVKFQISNCESHAIDLFYTEDIARTKRVFSDEPYWLSRALKFAKWTFPGELNQKLLQKHAAGEYDRSEGHNVIAYEWDADDTERLWLRIERIESSRIQIWLKYYRSNRSEVSKK